MIKIKDLGAARLSIETDDGRMHDITSLGRKVLVVGGDSELVAFGGFAGDQLGGSPMETLHAMIKWIATGSLLYAAECAVRAFNGADGLAFDPPALPASGQAASARVRNAHALLRRVYTELDAQARREALRSFPPSRAR